MTDAFGIEKETVMLGIECGHCHVVLADTPETIGDDNGHALFEAHKRECPVLLTTPGYEYILDPNQPAPDLDPAQSFGNEEPAEMCMLCLAKGPVNFTCQPDHDDAHIPLATSYQDANGEPIGEDQ